MLHWRYLLSIVCLATLPGASLAGVKIVASQIIDGLELRCEHLNPDVLPLQAVRLRIVLSNRGRQPAYDGPPVESSLRVRSISSAYSNGNGLQEVNGLVPFAPLGIFFAGPYQSELLHDSQPAVIALAKYQTLILRPGESESLTFSIAYDHLAGPKSCLFREPGEYEITIDDSYHSLRLPIAISSPNGNDHVIYQRLKKDWVIATEVMLTVTPAYGDAKYHPLTGEVSSIMNGVPRSSYSDYFEFALARAAVNGTFRAHKATKAQKRKAIRHLRQIDYNHFPEAPSALMLYLSIAGPEQYPAIKAILDTHFADSFEWLAEQAEWSAGHPARAMQAKKERLVRGPRWIARTLGPIELPPDEEETWFCSNWYLLLLPIGPALVVYGAVYFVNRKRRTADRATAPA